MACHLANPGRHPPPPDHLCRSRLSLVLAAVATVGGAANVAGLNVVRDVLLGVLFTPWTAWWISLLVVFAQIANSFHHLPIMTAARGRSLSATALYVAFLLWPEAPHS